jgi:hypothetical protein
MPIPSSAELPIQKANLDLIRWFIPILHRPQPSAGGPPPL